MDVFSRTFEGATPLHKAGSEEYYQGVPHKFRRGDNLDEVLALKPDVDAQDYEGFTPLHYAILVRDFSKIKKLIAAGANLELRNRYGDTALLLALHRAWDRHDIHATLLEAGADPYAKDLRGTSALTHAQEDKKPAFAHLLDQAEIDRPTPTEADLGKENWGKRVTSALYPDEYDHFRKEYSGAPQNVQWILMYALDTTRYETQNNGNVNRASNGKDVYGDNMGIVRQVLLEDKGFTAEQREQISRDVKAILVVESPEIDDEPYDRLQDRIVEFINRNPDRIVPKKHKRGPR